MFRRAIGQRTLWTNESQTKHNLKHDVFDDKREAARETCSMYNKKVPKPCSGYTDGGSSLPGIFAVMYLTEMMCLL